MKHEDFNSLDLTEVMAKTMKCAQMMSAASATHWISAPNLRKVLSHSPEIGEQGLLAEDMMSLHLYSHLNLDLQSYYHLWLQIGRLYPEPWAHPLPPLWIEGGPARCVLPLYFAEKWLGLLALDNPIPKKPARLAEALREPLGLCAKYIDFAYQLAEARAQSYLDEVTGLFNQRYLPMVLDHQIAMAKRDGRPFTLLFLDIDFFKKVNDSRGHMVGSKLLALLGELLKAQVRSTDYCFRYGGDEFVVVLAHSSSQQSAAVAERIRQAIGRHVFKFDDETIQLTVSIGLAAFPEHAESTSRLIQLADRAMYDGKQKGRNIVFVAREVK